MKKYLMTGVAALTLCAGFTSCSSNGDDIEPMSEQEIQEAKYNAGFIAKFGEPASNHSWGFGETTAASRFTRTAMPNSNQWFDPQYYNFVRPADITADEREVVKNWFANKQYPESQPVHWTDYFVQNIGYIEKEYTCYDGNNSEHKVKGCFQMDYIYSIKADGSEDHINNFNTASGEIQYMGASGTEGFGYNDSYGNGSSAKHPGESTHRPLAVIRHIVDSSKGVDGWYVGFDYATYGSNGDLDQDGYYTDRIIKICPAIPAHGKRIICEDLGATDDFDFNDVVFDAAYINGNGGYTLIIARAAGGTLPLTVGGVEIHQAFGVSTTDMVNTGRKSVPIAIFRTQGTYNNIKSIPIIVSRNAVQYTLKANAGEVPQKLCVNTDYVWTSEREPIDTKYPLFKNYVADEDVSWY